MNRSVRLVLAVAGIGLLQVACASDDALCAPLVAFVSAVPPKQSREFAFHTIWGGAFKDDPSPQAMYQARCIHHGFEPGKAVCDYLLKNGHVEFPGIDARRALECLSPTTHLDGRVRVDRGDFSLTFGTDERGSLVKVLFDADPEVGGMVLRITAEGY